MADENECSCSAAPKLIFACSGGADVGEIADRASRQLTAEGAGKMFCLAGIGGRVSDIMKTAESAAVTLAIDGCPVDCTRKTLERAGFKKFEHLRVTDLGMGKGRSPASEQRVARVVETGKALLADQA